MNLPYSDRVPSDLQVVLELTVDIQRQSPSYAVHVRVVVLCLSSGDRAQQLAFEDELALFVLLASLIRLIVFPADGLVTLFANDVSDNMSSGCHVSLHSLGLLDIYDVREEEGFAMLATEVARYNVIEVCKVRLALLITASLEAACMTADKDNSNENGVYLTLQPKIFCALRYVLYVRPIFLALPLYNGPDYTNDGDFHTKTEVTRKFDCSCRWFEWRRIARHQFCPKMQTLRQ